MIRSGQIFANFSSAGNINNSQLIPGTSSGKNSKEVITTHSDITASRQWKAVTYSQRFFQNKQRKTRRLCCCRDLLRNAGHLYRKPDL